MRGGQEKVIPNINPLSVFPHDFDLGFFNVLEFVHPGPLKKRPGPKARPVLFTFDVPWS
jgi:hypothetical protein